MDGVGVRRELSWVDDGVHAGKTQTALARHTPERSGRRSHGEHRGRQSGQLNGMHRDRSPLSGIFPFFLGFEGVFRREFVIPTQSRCRYLCQQRSVYSQVFLSSSESSKTTVPDVFQLGSRYVRVSSWYRSEQRQPERRCSDSQYQRQPETETESVRQLKERLGGARRSVDV